jgi:hypothetical protein
MAKIRQAQCNSWITWRQSLKKAFIAQGRRLRHPLGAWLRQDDTWPWYTTSDGSLFHLQDGQWTHHPTVARRNRLPLYERQGVPSEKPNRLYRASLYPKGKRLVCSGTAEIILPPCHHAESREAFLREDKEISWCLYQLQIHQCQGIVDSIKEGTVIAVCDGSYKDTFVTAAWVLLDEETGAFIKGSALCPGTARDHSS